MTYSVNVAQFAEKTYLHALDTIKGPFPKGEAIIAKSAEYPQLYGDIK